MGMIKPTIVVASTLLASPALAQANYFASPIGTANHVCSQAQPCTPQAAFEACSEATVPRDVCNIQLADGDYYDPAINVFYYRRADFIGNCNNPSSVRLIGTRQGTALIWVQDHAIGVFACIRLEGYTGNITGISGRQHVIVDYSRIVFGNMPAGTHVLMNEFSIASCVDVVQIAGDAAIHVGAFKNSAINLPSVRTSRRFIR